VGVAICKRKRDVWLGVSRCANAGVSEMRRVARKIEEVWRVPRLLSYLGGGDSRWVRMGKGVETWLGYLGFSCLLYVTLLLGFPGPGMSGLPTSL